MNTGSQRGQTLVLITVFMFSLLGMCAFAIDVGSWYQQKRMVQNAADAAALAGAVNLPGSWSAATTAADSEAGKNVSGATVTYTQSSTFVPGDSITVTVSKPATTYFAQMFTSKPVTTTSSATATMMNAGGGTLPWGVVDKPYTPGQSYPIYTDNSGANNGSISLPAVTNNGSCSASGANIYHDEIVGGIVTTCPVKVGDVLNVKGGQNAGPTQSAVSSRCPTLQPASSVVTFPGAGSPNILQPDSCQLVLLPTVLDDSTSTPVWPTSGHGDVRVTGFSWWVITAVSQQGKEVDAVYVGSAGSGTLPGAYVAQLTG